MYGIVLNHIPYWRVIRRMRLYFHMKEICAYTWDAPNKERFFQCRTTENNYALNSEYAPISDIRLITRQYGNSSQKRYNNFISKAFPTSRRRTSWQAHTSHGIRHHHRPHKSKFSLSECVCNLSSQELFIHQWTGFWDWKCNACLFAD